LFSIKSFSIVIRRGAGKTVREKAGRVEADGAPRRTQAPAGLNPGNARGRVWALCAARSRPCAQPGL
jgi:hypothetical protein